MHIEEIRDIAISAVGLAIAFALAFAGGVAGIADFSLWLVGVAFVAVSTSFILHELAHRWLARRYGFHAEYKMWPQGVALALVLSLFGFVFAAPGAVMIHPKHDIWGAARALTKRKMGLIALAGPLTNVAIAAIFTGLLFIAPAAVFGGMAVSEIFTLAITINIWLALFNMIPLFILDGQKVWDWDKRVWAAVFLPLVAMYFVL